MLVARYYAPGDVRMEDIPEPTPGPKEVKLRVHANSICGTDAKIFKHGHHRLDPPRVLGHELAGEVVEVGPEAVGGWSVGDRVQVIAAVPCGECEYCRRGWQTVCPTQKAVGYHWDGGLAKYIIIPEEVLKVDGLNPIADHVSYAEASVAEPFACALNAQELANVGEGDVVAVVGAGPIGCIHVRLARARGAKEVYLIELSRERLDLSAERVKPDAAICSAEVDPVAEVLSLTEGQGVDVVITAAGVGKVQEDALQMAALRGRISLFGGLPKDRPTITFDSNVVHYRELTVVGANGSSPAQNRRALEYIASGAVPVDDLITDRLPLERFVEGVEAVIGGTAIKVTIEP
jgi:L-iditol 2-dehydrogenase